MGRVEKGVCRAGFVKVSDECIGTFRRDFFVVISAKERAAVNAIEFLQELGDANKLVR